MNLKKVTITTIVDFDEKGDDTASDKYWVMFHILTANANLDWTKIELARATNTEISQLAKQTTEEREYTKEPTENLECQTGLLTRTEYTNVKPTQK